jgi:hypothetical protein
LGDAESNLAFTKDEENAAEFLGMGCHCAHCSNALIVWEVSQGRSKRPATA